MDTPSTSRNHIDLLMRDPRFPLHWQMTRTEQVAVIGVLDKIRPQLSLEVGTYRGGSLQVLAEFSTKVISLDSDPGVKENLAAQFPNVEFVTGDSAVILPELVAQLNKSGNTPEFVLVDGTHSTQGVRTDIESLLKLRPTREMVMLVHDSFNPGCRQGIRDAAWASSPYVHAVEIDFVPGGFMAEAYDTGTAGSMWAGFACAIFKPETRPGELDVLESGRPVFDAVFTISMYAKQPPVARANRAAAAIARARALAGRMKRLVLGL